MDGVCFGGRVWCGRCGVGGGDSTSASQAGVEALDEELESVEAVDDAGDGVGHRGEQVAGVCLGEGLLSDVAELHGSSAGEEPVGVDGEVTAEVGEELGAG